MNLLIFNLKAYKSSFGVAASLQLYVKFIAIAPTRELSRVRGCRELSLLVEKFLLVESRTMGVGLKTVFDSLASGDARRWTDTSYHWQ